MITVITATIDDRAHLLAELEASLKAQTVLPAKWLIGTGPGVNEVRNALAARVETEWLFPLDDDDLLDPHHFATLIPHLTDEWDIVHTWCRIVGSDEHPEDQFHLEAKSDADWQELRERNWIPNAAAIRTEFFHEVGGYRNATRWEDHDFWIRALDAGGRFHCVPEVTWTYRLNPEWEHRST